MADKLPRVILPFAGGLLIGAVITAFVVRVAAGEIRALTPFERCLLDSGCGPRPDKSADFEKHRDWVECAAPCFRRQYEAWCAEAVAAGHPEACPGYTPDE